MIPGWHFRKRQHSSMIFRTLEGYPNDHLFLLTSEMRLLQYDSCSSVAMQPAIQTGHSTFRTNSLSVRALRVAIVLDTPCRISGKSGCGPEMTTCRYTRAPPANTRVICETRDFDESDEVVTLVTSVVIDLVWFPELFNKLVSRRISISAARRTSSHVLKPPVASERLFHSLSVAISRMRCNNQLSQPMSLSNCIGLNASSSTSSKFENGFRPVEAHDRILYQVMTPMKNSTANLRVWDKGHSFS